MDRMTFRNEDGSWAVDESFLKSGSGPVIERLASYENMHENLEEQHRKTAEKLEELKSQGKLKSVTARQLIAQKLTFSNMLGMVDLYDNPSKEVGDSR